MMKLPIKNKHGFTLIEVMITIVVFSVIITAVYAAHTSQQNTYQVQDKVVEMQQNIRAAMYLTTSDIRMAGYDPLGTTGAGITVALPGRLQLTADLDDNGALGDPEELIDIGFSDAVNKDADGDGIPDSDSDGDGVPDAISVGRRIDNSAGGYQPIAENIQAVEFLYFDSAGAVTAVLGDIRSVQITILARASRSNQKFTNTMTYTTPSGQTWGPYNDNFRRRMLTTNVRCRNLGL